MGSSPNMPDQFAADQFAPPLILPLPSVYRRSEESEDSESPTSASAPGTAGRFSFPALPESDERQAAVKGPRIAWPECGEPEIARACAEMAGTLLQQLSLERSTVVAITSPGDGDGKTGVVVSLIPQLAKHFAKGILAVDADYRKLGLTKKLNLPGDGELHQSPLIYPTNIRRVSVLPAAIQAGRFDRSWIEQFREAWPLVLIDAPALTHKASLPIINRCDGAYLVVRLGHTHRKAVSEAAAIIRECGGSLLGCIVIG